MFPPLTNPSPRFTIPQVQSPPTPESRAMPLCTVTPAAYKLLVKIRGIKATDIKLRNGDHRIMLTGKAQRMVQALLLGRKPNRRTFSQLIFYKAWQEKLITNAQYRATWGKI